MSDHAPRTIERHCDVAVVGGSAAGLAAALQLARQRRSVIVVDSGEPRNAPAAHMHGFLGRDGTPPSELATIAREEVRSYGVEVLAGRASAVARTHDDRFRVELVGGHSIVARRVVAATGIVDELPDIDGLAEHWGREVIHCAFCHGYEVRDEPIVQVITHPMGLHPTVLFGHLTSQLTVILHDGIAAHPDLDTRELEALRASGVQVIESRVTRVLSSADVDRDARVIGVEVWRPGAPDPDRVPASTVVVTPRFAARAECFTTLGLATTPHPTGLGDMITVDERGATSVRGLYAAGNVTDPSQQVLHAAAHGSKVGAMIAFDLAHDDVTLAARPVAHHEDWDHRYSGARLWSGRPNGSLVAEVASLAPGRALDVGAGEGGDAVWLAERGWTVTASDVSALALERVAAEAEHRGLEIECRHADANAREAYEPRAFDLVSAQYASIPRTPDDRAIENLLSAVAPGGILLVVGHDLTPMRTPIDTHTHSRAFDPDSFVRVDDVAAALEGSPHWEIELHEQRPRPGEVSERSPHVDDIVLRARRVA